MCRDTCRDPFLGLYRDCEGSVVHTSIVLYHLREVELLALLRLEAKADDATALTDHQCDVLWSKSLCGEDDVALVLTVFIIYE